ncbi:hypothetical protein AGMMS50249_7370 [candidate division SR1 bacterium]|nr:hypothetical protein AGMMS50249_7370 [candidate division SR1 bacterium]
MTKKEYLLSVINAIPDWEMGRGLKTLIENDQIEETTLDKLVVIFKGAVGRIVQTIKNNNILEITQQAIQNNQFIQQQATLDAQDIGNLESALASF